MTIGSIFGKSFGNVLFRVSVLMLEYYYMKFLIKCQLWSFWWNVNNGVSDKIIPTMNKIMKAIKYNVNIAIVDKLFFMWISYFIELIWMLSIVQCL